MWGAVRCCYKNYHLFSFSLLWSAGTLMAICQQIKKAFTLSFDSCRDYHGNEGRFLSRLQRSGKTMYCRNFTESKLTQKLANQCILSQPWTSKVHDFRSICKPVKNAEIFPVSFLMNTSGFWLYCKVKVKQIQFSTITWHKSSSGLFQSDLSHFCSTPSMDTIYGHVTRSRMDTFCGHLCVFFPLCTLISLLCSSSSICSSMTKQQWRTAIVETAMRKLVLY